MYFYYLSLYANMATDYVDDFYLYYYCKGRFSFVATADW